jgi:hypothetical protein
MVVPLDGAARTGTNLATTVTILDGGNNQQAFSMTYRLPDVEPPRLLAIDPPAGATRVGLWNVVREFQFSEPLAEESLSTNLFRTTNDSGFATPHTLSTSGNNVRLNFGSPLHPGVTYTNELVRGIADRSGNFLADADGNDLPDGLRAAFTTAAILSVSPTNDAPVLGGETVRVEVTYEPELGARYFR